MPYPSETDNEAPRFSDRYGDILNGAWAQPTGVSETAVSLAPSEQAVQALWHEQRFNTAQVRTREGHAIEVISPGWWNHHAGPDFRGAQIAFNGTLYHGDVEVHLTPEAWTAHGHQHDQRYDEVLLHVVLDARDNAPTAHTVSGRPLPVLVLRPLLEPGWEWSSDESPEPAACTVGACSLLIPKQGTEPLVRALELAAEWRMLAKARAIRERMDRVGGDQALFEAMMYAAGVSTFKHHFQTVARQLPYARAVQLARHDPLLLEAALLQIAGLMPESLPTDTLVPHHARLRALLKEHLDGLRPLPLLWKRTGIRPANHPERRIAGMARVLARTAEAGLQETILNIWRKPLTTKETIEEFGKLFPKAMGFWAEHCTWTSARLTTPIATVGSTRVHSIIGNVFIPMGIAVARHHRDRALEERVLEFFQRFPKEANNHVLDRMVPKLLGDSGSKLKMRFAVQQGMLQFYQDWCGPNPSCRNCTMQRFLDRGSER
jgi:hypothetical protein